jgi:hypothetical protein
VTTTLEAVQQLKAISGYPEEAKAAENVALDIRAGGLLAS